MKRNSKKDFPPLRDLVRLHAALLALACTISACAQNSQSVTSVGSVQPAKVAARHVTGKSFVVDLGKAFAGTPLTTTPLRVHILGPFSTKAQNDSRAFFVIANAQLRNSATGEVRVMKAPPPMQLADDDQLKLKRLPLGWHFTSDLLKQDADGNVAQRAKLDFNIVETQDELTTKWENVDNTGTISIDVGPKTLPTVPVFEPEMGWESDGQIATDHETVDNGANLTSDRLLGINAFQASGSDPMAPGIALLPAGKLAVMPLTPEGRFSGPPQNLNTANLPVSEFKAKYDPINHNTVVVFRSEQHLYGLVLDQSLKPTMLPTRLNSKNSPLDFALAIDPGNRYHLSYSYANSTELRTQSFWQTGLLGAERVLAFTCRCQNNLVDSAFDPRTNTLRHTVRLYGYDSLRDPGLFGYDQTLMEYPDAESQTQPLQASGVQVAAIGHDGQTQYSPARDKVMAITQDNGSSGIDVTYSEEGQRNISKVQVSGPEGATGTQQLRALAVGSSCFAVAYHNADHPLFDNGLYVNILNLRTGQRLATYFLKDGGQVSLSFRDNTLAIYRLLDQVLRVSLVPLDHPPAELPMPEAQESASVNNEVPDEAESQDSSEPYSNTGSNTGLDSNINSGSAALPRGSAPLTINLLRNQSAASNVGIVLGSRVLYQDGNMVFSWMISDGQTRLSEGGHFEVLVQGQVVASAVYLAGDGIKSQPEIKIPVSRFAKGTHNALIRLQPSNGAALLMATNAREPLSFSIQ